MRGQQWPRRLAGIGVTALLPVVLPKYDFQTLTSEKTFVYRCISPALNAVGFHSEKTSEFPEHVSSTIKRMRI
jgi:hypothetical protein